MDFTLVFPSNAQPETYANTASQFQTDLENPIDLPGSWEVALQDLSYVNTIRSIHNESVMLGHTHEDDRYIPGLEHAKKLVHYDLQQHSGEWGKKRRKRSASLLIMSDEPIFEEDEEEIRPRFKRSVSQQEVMDESHQSKKRFRSIKAEYAHIRKINKLLAVLNRLGRKIWSWHFDRQFKLVLLTTKDDTYQNYGFYVTDDLRRVLALKSNLFLPTHEGFKVEGSGAFALTKGKLMFVSKRVEEVKHWENLRLNLTLLPLKRMKVKTIPIRPGAYYDFADSVNVVKGIRFHWRPETDPQHFQLIYNNMFEESDVAFMHLNEKAQKYLSMKHDVLWDALNFDIKYPNFQYQKQSDCVLTLFMKELKPSPERPISWAVKQEVKIPSKYYSNGFDLVTYLNKGDKTQFDYEFIYDGRNNKFMIDVKNKTVMKLSKTLASTLGFSNTIFHQESLIGSITLLNMNINHYYIYANFIQPTQVGGKPVPLLRYGPIDAGRFGQTMYKEFLNKVYIPVSVSRLQHVEFGIFDDAGEPIEFIGGRTVLTLSFRKVK